MSLIPSTFGSRRSNAFDPSLDAWGPYMDYPYYGNTTNLPESFREFASLMNSLSTRTDWRETPEAHVFKADLPGMKKEEVKVEIKDDRVLQISGERKVEKEENETTWHNVERCSGRFQRSFRLPEKVKIDAVKAAMENGVLTVTIPKVVEKKPEVKSIQISG